MVVLSPCGSPSPSTGLINPEFNEPVGGLTIAGILGGSQLLPVGAIPISSPLFGSPVGAPTVIGVRIGSGLTLDGTGAIAIVGMVSPGAHATTHEPWGVDAWNTSVSVCPEKLSTR